jgi:hypothetical protein
MNPSRIFRLEVVWNAVLAGFSVAALALLAGCGNGAGGAVQPQKRLLSFRPSLFWRAVLSAPST